MALRVFVKNLYLYFMYKVTVDKKDFTIASENGSNSIDTKPFDADVLEFKEGKFHIISDHQSFTAEVISYDNDEKSFEIKVNSTIYTVKVKNQERRCYCCFRSHENGKYPEIAGRWSCEIGESHQRR